MTEENCGSPLVSQTEAEHFDTEIHKLQINSSKIDLIETDKFSNEANKIFKHFFIYTLLSFSGFSIIFLTFIFRKHLNRTVNLILYEIGFFLALPIFMLFFQAYHFFLTPMFSILDDLQEKTEPADIGA